MNPLPSNSGPSRLIMRSVNTPDNAEWEIGGRTDKTIAVQECTGVPKQGAWIEINIISLHGIMVKRRLKSSFFIFRANYVIMKIRNHMKGTRQWQVFWTLQKGDGASFWLATVWVSVTTAKRLLYDKGVLDVQLDESDLDSWNRFVNKLDR